jgi:hypothetical protein
MTTTWKLAMLHMPMMEVIPWILDKRKAEKLSIAVDVPL